jgi:hypothetical protein
MTIIYYDASASGGYEGVSPASSKSMSEDFFKRLISRQINKRKSLF